MTSRSPQPNPRRLLAFAFSTGLLVATTRASAAEPPPASPPPAARAASLEVPFAAPPQVRYPDYLYFAPQPWAATLTPGAPLTPGMPTQRVWYGWQTLILLGASFGTGLVGTVASSGGNGTGFGVTLALGGTGLLFGGPIVHWAHGHASRGFLALGLNAGIPLVAGGIGAGITCAAGGCSHGSDGILVALFGMAIGGGLGLVTAHIIDVSVLSYDTRSPGGAETSRRAPGWTILPDVHVSKEKTTFGVAGIF